MAIVAFVLFVIAAIMAWLGNSHAEAVAYAGLAVLALSFIWSWEPWHRGPRA
jgi:hypothetical protein